MSIDITLNDVGSLIDVTTAQTTINNNNDTIVNAFNDALSTTSQTGSNEMNTTLDMNNYPVVNLPAPISLNSPLRLADANTLNGGGTITGLPTGGTTNQALVKNSNVNYDTKWLTVPSTPGTTVVDNLTAWNATNGSALKDSGLVTNQVVTLTGSQTLSNKTLVAPALGTPASGVATNLTGTAAGLTAGSVTTNANLSGPVTSVGNATSITTNAVTNTHLAQMAANTIKGNNTGGTANAADLSVAQVAGMLSSPQVTTFTSGSGTYTTPTNAKYLVVEIIGGGGGSAGSGTTPGNGGAGGNTTFGSSFLTANGGGAGTSSVGGAGGSATGGDINILGSQGGAPTGASNQSGGNGGSAAAYSNPASLSGIANVGQSGTGFGAGASGAGDGATANTGGGGGGGAYVKKLVTSPSASYAYAVGAAGTAGTAGTGGFAGAAGTAGAVIVTAYFQ